MGPTTLRQLLAVQARILCATGGCGENAADLTAGHTSTLAVGTTFAPLTTATGKAIRVYNDTGTSLDFKLRLGAGTNGTMFTVASAASLILPCLANANEWKVRRNDQGTLAGGTAVVVASYLVLNVT
jgi:hypothetical protein